MDATTLQDVAQRTEQLAVGDAVLLAKSNMKICQLKYQGKTLSLKLGESQNTTVAFEPSVYNGTGEEIRKGVVFCIGDEDYGGMAALEQWCKDSLRATNPNIDTLWCSSAKRSEKWGPLKAKINLGGGLYGAKFYDEAKEPCDAPQEWRGLKVSVILQIRGC